MCKSFADEITKSPKLIPPNLLENCNLSTNLNLNKFVLVGDSHYEVTMSGALMANSPRSWRLQNNVTSSKYLVMHAFRDH